MIALHVLTAFLSGAGVLVVEMTATRALAPYFGQAQFVWTNVIGLILMALAIGNYVGGRLADRTVSMRVLGVLLVASAVLVAGSAFLPGPVARAILPENLPLEAAYSFMFHGSFVATLICFVPPVLLLGAVPPFLVRCATRRVEEIGRTSGMLYASSTIGSIAGAFLTSNLLLVSFGIRGTLLLAGALLAAASAPAFLSVRRPSGRSGRVVALVAVAAIGAAAFTIETWVPELLGATPGAALGRLVVAKESRYQHLEVRERDDLPVPARVLVIDEGHDSVQSVTPLQGVLTGGLYYDYLTLLALDVARGGRLRMAILGFGAGTHARQILHFAGDRCDLSIVGVELDPDVVELARRELDLPSDSRLTIHVDLDARTFVDHVDDRFDLILVDCYNRQSFLPSHVASREFFSAARARLADGGVLALNLFGYGARDPVVEAVTNTLSTVFASDVACCALPQTANYLVYAQRAPAPRLPGVWDTTDWPEECRQLAARLTAPAQAFRTGPRAELPVLTDDCGDLDRLQEARLRRRSDALLRSVR